MDTEYLMVLLLYRLLSKWISEEGAVVKSQKQLIKWHVNL